MRIVIIDNHSLLRAGLRMLLSAEDDLNVVADAGSGEESLDVIARERPDVVILDLSTPGFGGLEATRKIAARAPGTRVVILTRFTDYAHMREAMEAGAAGYVLKSAPPEQMLDALRTVAAGRTYVDPGVQMPVPSRPATRADTSTAGMRRLSAREYEVLRAAAAGESSKQIANRLALSTRTVEFHKYKAMRRLGLRGRAALLKFALDMGWLRDSQE